jgi:hypothetical protein
MGMGKTSGRPPPPRPTASVARRKRLMTPTLVSRISGMSSYSLLVQMNMPRCLEDSVTTRCVQPSREEPPIFAACCCCGCGEESDAEVRFTGGEWRR